MKIRIQSASGWNAENRQAVIKACQEHNLIFVDRGNVGDSNMGIKHLIINSDKDVAGLKGYVFFTHRGMPDLPYTRTIHVSP